MRKDNLASGVYERVKRGILSLEFPPGFLLQERNLAEELGVSRTPVREAVHRLSQEGWLQVNARKNIQVRPVSPSDLREVFQARRILERDALELLLSTGLAREAGRKMAAMATVMNESGEASSPSSPRTSPFTRCSSSSSEIPFCGSSGTP